MRGFDLPSEHLLFHKQHHCHQMKLAGSLRSPSTTPSMALTSATLSTISSTTSFTLNTSSNLNTIPDNIIGDYIGAVTSNYAAESCGFELFVSPNEIRSGHQTGRMTNCQKEFLVLLMNCCN